MSDNFYIYGAGGHAKVVAEIAENNNLKLRAFIDDNIIGENKKLFNYPVKNNVYDTCFTIIIGVGDNFIRRILSEKYCKNQFVKLIDPSANISQRSKIGNGTVCMPGVTVNSCVKIGWHCIINTNCSIDHDSVLEDFVHVSPNASLAGNVIVGEGAHIGIGASVIQGVKIGKWAIVGAGAVIINDVPDGATVVGNPGRILPKK